MLCVEIRFMTALLASNKPLDAWAIDVLGYSPLQLMEVAGHAVAQRLLQRFAGQTYLNVVVLAGTGNNGGDAYVVARLLHNAGWRKLLVISTGTPTTPEAQHMAHQAMALGIAVVPLNSVLVNTACLNSADVIVDGLVGCGLQGALREREQQLVTLVNQQQRRNATAELPNPKAQLATLPFVMAIDIPSGVEAGTGAIAQHSGAILANETVGLSVGKPAYDLYPGKAYRGVLSVAGLGLPLASAWPATLKPVAYRLSQALAQAALPKRNAHGHKYDQGHVLAVAGSTAYPGAGHLVCQAAYKAGAGLVTWATDATTLAQGLPLPEVVPLPIDPADPLGKLVADWLQSKVPQAVVYGPGLGLSQAACQQTQMWMMRFLAQYSGFVVLDADALGHLAMLFDQQVEALPPLAPFSHRMVVTPHWGELKRLFSDLADLPPLQAAQGLADRLNCQVLLKTPVLIHACPSALGYQPLISPYGNDAAATAGTGDVLAGLVAGLAAQHTSLAQACVAAMALHGEAITLAAEAETAYGVTASSVVAYLPQAFKRCLAGQLSLGEVL
jgi:hydroxyethylthiazole kinase-like uncharacterized protein yjeF